MEAALSDTLSTVVLLGRDVPELSQLLGGRKARELYDTNSRNEAMMVTTRYGTKEAEGTEGATLGAGRSSGKRITVSGRSGS